MILLKYGIKRIKNKLSVSKYNNNNEFLDTYVSLEEAARKNKL